MTQDKDETIPVYKSIQLRKDAYIAGTDSGWQCGRALLLNELTRRIEEKRRGVWVHIGDLLEIIDDLTPDEDIGESV